MKRRAALAFLVASATSAVVWALSPAISGHAEPWDADGLFYIGSLLVAGLFAGALVPQPLWAHYLGAVFGQLAYEVIFLKIGPLILIGVVFLLGYSLLFLVAAAIAGYVRLRYTDNASER